MDLLLAWRVPLTLRRCMLRLPSNLNWFNTLTITQTEALAFIARAFDILMFHFFLWYSQNLRGEGRPYGRPASFILLSHNLILSPSSPALRWNKRMKNEWMKFSSGGMAWNNPWPSVPSVWNKHGHSRLINKNQTLFWFFFFVLSLYSELIRNFAK